MRTERLMLCECGRRLVDQEQWAANIHISKSKNITFKPWLCLDLEININDLWLFWLKLSEQKEICQNLTAESLGRQQQNELDVTIAVLQLWSQPLLLWVSQNQNESHDTSGLHLYYLASLIFWRLWAPGWFHSISLWEENLVPIIRLMMKHFGL